MAVLEMEFDAATVEPSKALDVLTPGDYTAMIVESERKITKAGNGEYLKLVWQITEGEYEGRKIFGNVNLKNPNPQAVEIGMRELSAICHAVGVLRVSDSAELHNIPCILKVKIRAAGPDRSGVIRDAQNEIKGYEPLDGSAPAATAAAPALARSGPAAAAPQRTSTAPAKKPWQKN